MEEDHWQPPTNNGRARKIVPVALVIALIVVAVVITLGVKGVEPAPTPTPTPTPTPSPTPIVTMSCEIARDSIQPALDAYHAEHGEWPTADGQPGDIYWDKLVPAFMDITPSNDARCDWRVNSDPEGEVCVPKRC